MQFKVPQNIDMADRIVGSLTLVQFLYLLVGGMIVYSLFTTIAPVNGTLFILTGGPLTLFTLALAFLKIQDQPFPKFVFAFLMYLSKPKARVWHHGGLDPNLVVGHDKREQKAGLMRKNIDKSQLDKLVHVIDNGGTVLSGSKTAAPPSLIKKSRPLLDTVRK